jgi:hypothetical protein
MLFNEQVAVLCERGGEAFDAWRNGPEFDANQLLDVAAHIERIDLLHVAYKAGATRIGVVIYAAVSYDNIAMIEVPQQYYAAQPEQILLSAMRQKNIAMLRYARDVGAVDFTGGLDDCRIHCRSSLYGPVIELLQDWGGVITTEKLCRWTETGNIDIIKILWKRHGRNTEWVATLKQTKNYAIQRDIRWLKSCDAVPKLGGCVWLAAITLTIEGYFEPTRMTELVGALPTDLQAFVALRCAGYEGSDMVITDAQMYAAISWLT